MILYATEEQLTSWIGSEPDVDSTAPYLRAASVLVHRAVRNDIYDTAPNGTPSDPDLAEAVTEATCAQAEVWIAMGVNPVAGAGGQEARPTVSAIDGASVSFDTYLTAQAFAEAVENLAPAALSILRAAGLASAAVRG